MKKQFIKYALTALTFSALLSINTAAVETKDNSIKIDESGNITLMSNHVAKNEITSLQLSLKVEADTSADISFEIGKL